MYKPKEIVFTPKSGSQQSLTTDLVKIAIITAVAILALWAIISIVIWGHRKIHELETENHKNIQKSTGISKNLPK